MQHGICNIATVHSPSHIHTQTHTHIHTDTHTDTHMRKCKTGESAHDNRHLWMVAVSAAPGGKKETKSLYLVESITLANDHHETAAGVTTPFIAAESEETQVSKRQVCMVLSNALLP